MGKKIIIPGADFSTNGIAPEEIQLALSSFGIDLADDAGYGANNTIGYNRVKVNDNILIPNGASIMLKGLKGRDGQQDALRVDYCYYVSETRSHSTVVGSYSNKVSADFYTLNASLADEIIITNNYGQDYWFGLTFRRDDNTNIEVSSYSPLVYILN